MRERLNWQWIKVHRGLYNSIRQQYEAVKPLQVLSTLTDMDGNSYSWSTGEQQIVTVWGYLIENDDFDQVEMEIARYSKIGDNERFELWVAPQLPSLDSLKLA